MAKTRTHGPTVKMSVSLSPDIEQRLKAKLASGKFASTDQVMDEALNLLDRYETEAGSELEWLRREIKVGLDSLENEGGIPADEVFKEIRRKSENRRQSIE